MAPSLTSLKRACVLAVVTVFLAALALVAPDPARACACGAFVGEESSTVQVEEEVAAIAWDGQTERMILSLAALSQANEAALLLPTPAPATVQLAEEGMFDELDDLTSPEVEVEYYWWPRDRDTSMDGGGAPGGVSVLETVDLGPVEATVLDASNPDDLAQWLEEHDYVMDDSLAQAVRPYVTEGWYYVAVRLTAPGNLTGTIPPLDISFESSSMVYPMRMSAAANNAQTVRTYVFAEQRMARADASADGSRIETRYAGVPDTSTVQSDTLTELFADGPYLTVVDQTFFNPSTEIVSDFIFERSSNGGDVQEVTVVQELRTIAGFAAGPFLLVSGLAVAVVVTGFLVARRRRRRRLQVVPPVPAPPAPAPANL